MIVLLNYNIIWGGGGGAEGVPAHTKSTQTILNWRSNEFNLAAILKFKQSVY